MARAREDSYEVTLSDLVRCGYPRSMIKDRLSKLTPARRVGRVVYYDLAVAIRAMNTDDGELDPRSRKELAHAELAEERVRRLRGESIDRAEVKSVWTEKLVRIRDAIKASEIPMLKDKRNLCAIIRAELDRVPGELEEAAFYSDEDE